MVTLPAGWKAKRDSQGRLYYACKATGKSQWTPPTAEQADDIEIGAGLSPPPLKSRDSVVMDAKALYDALDSDGDGKLTFDEFNQISPNVPNTANSTVCLLRRILMKHFLISV